ncbi:MAG: hypothetical protein U0T73_03105 [Chitinophagales bacterium]
MMKRIGFFGGCVTHQHNIPPESLFHAALRQSAGNYTLAFGHYLSFDQLVPSLSKFLEMHELETLYLFVRPFPLPPLHKLVVKYEDANGKARHALHPAFLNANCNGTKRSVNIRWFVRSIITSNPFLVYTM